MPEAEKEARGMRVKRLREALKLTQDQVAKRSGQPWTHSYVAKVERGYNAATSADVQRGLARGLGVQDAQFVPYLDGKLPIDRVLSPSGQRRESEVWSDVVLPGFREVGSGAGYSSREIEHASDSVRGLAGASDLKREKILELLAQARVSLRSAERLVMQPETEQDRTRVRPPKLAPTTIHDAGTDNPLDDLGGIGAGKAKMTGRKR